MLVILRILIWLCSLFAGLMVYIALTKNGLKAERGLFFLLASILAIFLNLLVLHVPYDATDSLSGQLIRFARRAAWIVNGLWIVLLGVAALATQHFLVMVAAVPSLAVFAYMLISARRAEASAASSVSVPIAAAQPPKTPEEFMAYLQRHRVEVAGFEQDFRRLLVEKYGFREDYVRKQNFEALLRPYISLNTRGDLYDVTPALLADQFFNDMFFSPDANNPEIFARNVDTDEPLPPDYDHTDLWHRALGRTTLAKVTNVLLLPLLVAVFYAESATYLPSAEWRVVSWLLAAGASGLLIINLYGRWKKGRLRTARGKRKYSGYAFFWMSPALLFMAWLLIYNGVGHTLHLVSNKPVKASYSYNGGSDRCLYIGVARFCPEGGAIKDMPEEGNATFIGKRSWFGTTIDSMTYY
jgi:hypothetical protein